MNVIKRGPIFLEWRWEKKKKKVGTQGIRVRSLIGEKRVLGIQSSILPTQGQ